MHCYWNQVGRSAVLAACCSLSLLAAQAIAQEDASILVQQPAPPASEQPQQHEVQPAEEAIPAPASSQGVVHPAPPIKYHTSRSARRMLRGEEMVEIVMVTRNPADGCIYEIPLCLPACCVGAPTVEERCGPRGRGVVEYCWECGFEATVKFRHRMRDVKVDYDS